MSLLTFLPIEKDTKTTIFDETAREIGSTIESFKLKDITTSIENYLKMISPKTARETISQEFKGMMKLTYTLKQVR